MKFLYLALITLALTTLLWPTAAIAGPANACDTTLQAPLGVAPAADGGTVAAPSVLPQPTDLFEWDPSCSEPAPPYSCTCGNCCVACKCWVGDPYYGYTLNICDPNNPPN